MNFMLKKYAIIVAGGTGSRMKSKIPKQFMLLNDRPILMHTMEKFAGLYSGIELIVVLNKHFMDQWSALCANHHFTLSHRLIPGGGTRFDSVKNGLAVIEEENGIIAVHDAVRPFVSYDTIHRCFSAAEEKGNGIPCINTSESLRFVDDSSNHHIDRSKIKTIQTPQVFQLAILKQAYEKVYKHANPAEYTDDASVVEKAGHFINLVEGNPENIKITNHLDLLIARCLSENL